jgi:hypothetical protein
MKGKVNFDKYAEELKEAKKLYVLTKKRSPYSIEYIEDPDDSWFVYVVKIRNTTKKYEQVSMIIQKDVDTWLNNSLSKGWVIN